MMRKLLAGMALLPALGSTFFAGLALGLRPKSDTETTEGMPAALMVTLVVAGVALVAAIWAAIAKREQFLTLRPAVYLALAVALGLAGFGAAVWVLGPSE